MTNVFIFYGVGGSSEENWFPWLKKELCAMPDFNVIIPKFPTPENQTLDNWLKVLEKYKDFLREDTILIGHSLGGLFALSVLEKYSVKAAFFVASFSCLPGNKFDDSMRTFAKDFDWAKIRKNCEKFFIFHGDNDPYVKLETALLLAKNLKTSVTVVEGSGHFNIASGYSKFPLLLEKLKEFFV